MAVRTRVHPAKAQSAETFDITLQSLGYSDQVLEGPFDAAYYYFSLPSEWQPQDGSYLELHLDHVVGGEWSRVPALLVVRLNGDVLDRLMLNTLGPLNLSVEIPSDAFRLSESSYFNELRLSLQTADCEFPQRTMLTVQSTSVLHLAYSERPVPLDLALYPKPLYHSRAFEPSQVRFVLPTEPTQAEVRAAVMIAARLGRLTYDNLQLNASPLPDVAAATTLDEHLIVIGQPDRMPVLQEFELPVPLIERQLALRSEMPGTIVPGQPFSYTLTVENTSQVRQELIVEDLLPEAAIFVDCQGRCEATTPGTVKWQVGHLAPGEQASTVVSLRLDSSAPLGESQEHTASLFDSDGNLLNVDTLPSEVAAADDGRTVASAAGKDSFMFTLAGTGVAEGDGMVQEIVSPWSARRALIVVTGLNDDALLKAAHALGSASRFPGMSGPYALVQAAEVKPEEMIESAQDMSFAFLGYEDETLTVITDEMAQYAFDLPGEWAITDNAYLALHFAHSAILADLLSSLEISLNDVPVGSVNLDEQYANDTRLTIPLPRTPLRTGRNYLRMRLVGTIDRCALIRDSQLWLTIYADSGLHLPYESAESPLDLAYYPQPFSDQSSLENVVFSLPARPTTAEVEGVLRLASWLGNASRGSNFVPQVVLGGDPETKAWTGFDIIAVGRPTSNPYIAVANEALPQPFRSGTDEVRQQVDDLIYRLPADVSLGYVQELPSPQDKEQAMLVVTGTTDESIAWALAALVDDALVNRLAGDLALVRGDQMQTIDTREQTTENVVELIQALAPELTLQATAIPATSPSPTLSPAAASETPTPASTLDRAEVEVPRPKWLIPLLILSIAVAAVGIGIAVRGRRF